ncbi:MAG: VCBS repeat-containing protein, partial [Calditrichaeota bacterium]|nr:VCBS repeat-containing protein [Calditrichota bacterium]
MPLIVLICLISKINCQKLADSYRIDQSISFNLNGKQINYPLSGGYQSLYLQSLDWDSDNLIDLVILNNGFSQPLIFEQAHVKSSNFNPVDFNFDNIFLERWFQFVDFDFDGDYDVLTLDGFDVLGVEINSGSNDAPHFGEFQRLKDDEDQLIITEFGNFPVVFDYNSDTKFDLFLTTQGDGRVRYYQNTGTEISSFHLVSNSFANISVLAAGKKHGKSTFSFIETGPDHRLDILWGDQFQNYFYYLTNIGDRENPDYMISDPLYDANGTIISSAAYNAPFITDLNRDGFSDLIMLPQFSNAANFHLYISDSISGEWQLNSTQLITTIDEGLLSFLDFYDIDSDGDPDLIISTFRNAANYYHLSFYENTGINSKQFSEFEFSKTLVFPWQNLLVNAYDFQIIDLNTDNKWDIVFTDDNGNLQVAYNSGTNLNPNFSNFFSIRNGLGNFASFRIVDLNFDTKPDLITANQSGRVQLFQTTVSLFDQLISTNLLNHQFDGWINIDHLKDNSFILYHQKEKTFYQFIVND